MLVLDNVDADWTAYKERGSVAARDALVVHYLPLVARVAKFMARGMVGVEEEEFNSLGVFGLMDAITKFDPDRGVKFDTYAKIRIRGRIMDSLRTADWVPRSVRANARRVDKATVVVETRLQRTASGPEVAEELGLTLREFQFLDVGTGESTLSLDETFLTDSAAHDSANAADTVVCRRSDVSGLEDTHELKRLLAETIQVLPSRERIVLTLYYDHGMPMAAIAELLEVTGSRVCQIHTRMLVGLRNGIARV